MVFTAPPMTVAVTIECASDRLRCEARTARMPSGEGPSKNNHYCCDYFAYQRGINFPGLCRKDEA